MRIRPDVIAFAPALLLCATALAQPDHLLRVRLASGVSQAGAKSAAGSQTPPAQPRPLTATFIGNEAWHITDGEYTLLTDFPYQSGYSRYMTWEWSGVPKVPDPLKLLIVTTHQHRDHFAAELVSRLSPAGVMGPATVRAAAPDQGIPPNADARFGPIRVQAVSTPHAELEHYSYIIEWHGVSMYLPGDTEGARSVIEAKNLDVAFVTPWMLRAAERGRAKIDARRVVVVHHEAGETVAPYQGSTVPKQGEVMVLRAAPPEGQRAAGPGSKVFGGTASAATKRRISYRHDPSARAPHLGYLTLPEEASGPNAVPRVSPEEPKSMGSPF